MEERQRLFFALIPPDDIKQQINDFRTNLLSNYHLQDHEMMKLVSPGNFHLTLLFLGEIQPIFIPNIIEYANKINIKNMSLNFNTIGYFKRSMVLWLGLKSMPYELEYLVDGLKVNIKNVVNLDSIQRPSKFIPHLTIIKKLNNIFDYPNLLKQYVNIEWSVESFYLIKSIRKKPAVNYEILSEFSILNRLLEP